jgi:hypothetical protein
MSSSDVRLICLLAARNCEHLLPGYFRSIERLADAVVALDDGSTDGTRAALGRQPLVQILLDRPSRRRGESDESANRNALLAAAGELDPDWLISIDADERVPALDAAALRRFVETRALPGCAFGLQRFSIEGDRCRALGDWTHRLFAFRRGQSFPLAEGCFDPVPLSTAPHTWIKTTFRLGHLARSNGAPQQAATVSNSPSEPLSTWLARAPEPPCVLQQPTSPYAAVIASGDLVSASMPRIEIDRRDFALRLYRGRRLEKSYPITIGMPKSPTVPGVFAVSSALYKPSWIVPRGESTGQVVSADDEINPIREHWIGLEDGIGIHGTRYTRALGSPISLGCVGLAVRDVVDLYPHVQLGTQVVVL